MMSGKLGKFDLKLSYAVMTRFNLRDPEKQTENFQFWKKNQNIKLFRTLCFETLGEAIVSKWGCLTASVWECACSQVEKKEERHSTGDWLIDQLIDWLTDSFIYSVLWLLAIKYTIFWTIFLIYPMP